MGVTNMLTYTLRLDQQPGGVSPELHLKQNADSVYIQFIITPGSTLTNAIPKRCVVKGIRPDGAELFLTCFSQWLDHELSVTLYRDNVRRMVPAIGAYRCTLTILDTDASVTRENYMNYDCLTVLPFTVIVHEAALQEGG